MNAPDPSASNEENITTTGSTVFTIRIGVPSGGIPSVNVY